MPGTSLLFTTPATLVATANSENNAMNNATNDTAHRYDAYGLRPSGSGSPRPANRNTTTISTSGTMLTSSDRPTNAPPANIGGYSARMMAASPWPPPPHSAAA